MSKYIFKYRSGEEKVETGLPCAALGCPITCYGEQDGLELIEIPLPLPPKG